MKRSKVENVHHRKQRKDGGKTIESNLIKVPKRLHQFYHAFFVEGTYPPQMAEKLNRWIDPDFTLICVPTEKAHEARKLISQLT